MKMTLRDAPTSLLKSARIILFCLGVPLLAAPAIPGIENFYQLNDHVYRGAQPSSQGFDYLAKNGIKTVIDLRERDDRSMAEERTVTAAGMRYVNVPMTGLTPPTDAEIARILSLLEDASAGPVFVHCKRGADRTGAMIGAYRIHHDGWEGKHALDEAMSRGMSGFQIPRQKYIRSFKMLGDAKPVMEASSKIPGENAVAAVAAQ